MERLTDKITNIETGKVLAYRLKREVDSLKGIQKLGSYEDAEEQGLLLRLPCPIGTKVYNTTWWDDVKEKIKVDGKTFHRIVHKHKVSKSTFSYFDIDKFGKTVFLTKEEAEQALAERKNDE